MKFSKTAVQTLSLGAILILSSFGASGQQESKSTGALATTSSEATSQIRLRFKDGTSIPVDEAWESEQGIWYRQSGISHLVARERIRTIERSPSSQTKGTVQVAMIVTAPDPAISTGPTTEQPVWIYLVGGARVEADSAIEAADGVWYRRGPLSVFVDRVRIDHIEREPPDTINGENFNSSRERGWTTGNRHLDGLIRQNGFKYGVDPYLIFCVMEQESHFNSRALSPKGARGLMQLMPGTAARFGVKRPSDPAQNIAGGTRYLKQLIGQFDGRVDLVLASYNAGEGAVLKFGRKVPPYRETRDYVKKISYRYRRNRSTVYSKGELASPAVRAGT